MGHCFGGRDATLKWDMFCLGARCHFKMGHCFWGGRDATLKWGIFFLGARCHFKMGYVQADQGVDCENCGKTKQGHNNAWVVT